MKVIFLDIDGVLNGPRTRNPRKFPYVAEPRLVRRFQAVLKRTGAKAVLSSSWRLDPVGLLAAKYWGIPFADSPSGHGGKKSCAGCSPIHASRVLP